MADDAVVIFSEHLWKAQNALAVRNGALLDIERFAAVALEALNHSPNGERIAKERLASILKAIYKANKTPIQ